MEFNRNNLGLVKHAAEVHGVQEAQKALANYKLTPELIQKSIGDYALDERVVGQEAESLIMYMWQQTPIMSEFSHKNVRNRVTKIPLGVTDKEFLISTERMGRQLNPDEKQGLGAVHSFDVYCEEVEAQWDIKMGDLIYNLGTPHYMETLERAKVLEIANDISRLAARGVQRNAQGFYNLLYGFPHRLKNMNGKTTYSAASDEIVGKHGFLVTPVKVDAGSGYTDADILDLMSKMIDNTETQFQSGAKFLMSRYDAGVYADMRSQPMAYDGSGYVGVNVGIREAWVTSGIVPNWKGYQVVHCEHLERVANGGVIVYGDLKNLLVVTQTQIDITREYKARLDVGGNGYEFTYVFYMNFAIMKPYAMTVAFKGAKAEAPVFLAGAGIKADEIIGTVDVDGEDAIDIYVYTDTVGGEIWYSDNSSHLDNYSAAVAGAAKINPADPEITLTEGTYYFRVFKDGVLTHSDKVTLEVTNIS